MKQALNLKFCDFLFYFQTVQTFNQKPISDGSQSELLIIYFQQMCLLSHAALVLQVNSCPVCRHELPTDDPDYEEYRKHKVRVGLVLWDFPNFQSLSLSTSSKRSSCCYIAHSDVRSAAQFVLHRRLPGVWHGYVACWLYTSVETCP